MHLPTRKSLWVPSGAPTVTQHLIVANQRPSKPREWMLSLVDGEDERLFGEFKLNNSPNTQLKRVALVALELGRSRSRDACLCQRGRQHGENRSYHLRRPRPEDVTDDDALDEELRDLSEFCRRSIHPNFLLVDLVKRGVAFHYGNMPTILRTEIERLFREGEDPVFSCVLRL